MQKSFFCCLCALVLAFVSCSKTESAAVEAAGAEVQLNSAAEIEAEKRRAEEKALLEEKAKIDSAIDAYLDKLTLDEKIAQLFAVGIDGNDILHSYAKKEFAGGAPGSFLLFDANIGETAEQTINFTDSVLPLKM
ncbi:MAG: hypothetical protein J5631_14525 [Spirochaetaceae bacterium]|nr:hypothetical protein [Spirochaetaceae bacterium]